MTESRSVAQPGVLGTVRGLRMREDSLQSNGVFEFGLDYGDGSPRLAVLASDSSTSLAAFEGEHVGAGAGRTLLLGPLSARNAGAVRSELSALRPRPLGLLTSAGFGDRLGLATPGHVRALRAAGNVIAPI
ncbi:MAG: tagaturonate epimerase family protein, partial [Rubrobacter sp.]|nr:tagaturonate epimerase family protein [Rubrobacter sp.]